MTDGGAVKSEEARLSTPIALDAMGADKAPLVEVRGAAEYARMTGRPVLLVGRPADIAEAMRAARVGDARLEVVPASEVIDFGEKITSIRSKRDSSIHVGVRLVRDGKACAFVSAGHTGAVMAISKVAYRLIEGGDRPALPAPLPRPRARYTGSRPINWIMMGRKSIFLVLSNKISSFRWI